MQLVFCLGHLKNNNQLISGKKERETEVSVNIRKPLDEEKKGEEMNKKILVVWPWLWAKCPPKPL